MEAHVVGQPGFSIWAIVMRRFSATGDPLDRLSSGVDFELFRGPLTAALRRGLCRKRRPAAIGRGDKMDIFYHSAMRVG